MSKIKPSIAFLFGTLISIITFFNFLISPGTLIYLDFVPSLYPEKALIESFSSTWGSVALADIPFQILYLIPISKLIGVFNAWKIFWLISFGLGSYFIYKIFKENNWNYWYIASLILLFNPFIYGRILAGQIGMVISTVLSPIFLYFLFKYFENPNIRNSIYLALSYLFSSMLQAHYFILNGIIFIIYSLILLIKRETNLKTILISLLFIILINSYWLVFLPFQKPVMLSIVNQIHLEFFSPRPTIKTNEFLEAYGLYGFWRETFIKTFYVDYPNLYPLFLSFFISLIFLGYYRNPRDSKNLLFLILFILGISLTLFTKYLSFIPLLNAFRDSQKFAYLTLLSYSFLIPQALNKNKLLLLVFILIWIFYNHYQILLWDQLRPISYPKEYLDLNKYITENNLSNIMYLPWGIYYTYEWSEKAGLDGRIANPINAVVKEFVITGCRPDLDFCYEDKLQRNIRMCLENKNITCLEDLGIRYIILDNYAETSENYDWLKNYTIAEFGKIYLIKIV